MTTTLKLENAGQHYRDMAPKLQAAARRGLLSAAERGVQRIVSEIIPSRSPQPVDRGVYRAGWKARSIEDGAEILNTEAHAVFIEEGVRPGNVKAGRAMIAALLEWVVRKGMGKSRLAPSHTALRKVGGKLTASHTVLKVVHDEDANMQVVWAIIASMKKRGIFNRGGQGLGILKQLNNELPDICREEVTREIAKVFE